ncbi:hypothetical protein C357_23230 [Citreicella sp. 357]|nr:hypothetical protein C357_23230 [Citreicella sp. 357]
MVFTFELYEHMEMMLPIIVKLSTDLDELLVHWGF